MPNVLIVDDDPDVGQALADGLALAGACHVEPVCSAEEALAIVKRQRPDAAIIDVTMPRVSGLSLAQQFVELGIPSLLISGDPEHQRMLTAAGCPFLAKPFRLDQLLVETQALLSDFDRQLARLKAGLSRLTEIKAGLRNAVERSRESVAASQAQREARQRSDN